MDQNVFRFILNGKEWIGEQNVIYNLENLKLLLLGYFK